MQRLFDRFSRDEDGNAVIDWVVLLSGVTLMAISIVLSVTDPLDDITDSTVDQMEVVGASLAG